MADTLVDGDLDNNVPFAGNALWGAYYIDKDIGVIISVNSNNDIAYWRTTNAGVSWGTDNVIKAGTASNVSCWFDKETPGDTGDVVHIVWMDSVSSDLFYNNLDISTNTLGTERTISSTLTVNGTPGLNKICVTKTVSGNIICAYSTQVDIECKKSTDLFASVNTDIADVFEQANQEDKVLLFPADTSDPDDACAIFWDRGVDEISIKIYDDSGDVWDETTDASMGSMADDISFRNMDGAIRHSDGNLLMSAHSDNDSAGDDLKTWDVAVDTVGAGNATITAKTNVFTDQAESAQVAVVINQQTNDVYIAYLKGGTWVGSVDVVFHKSENGMTTWGGENEYSEEVADDNRMLHGGRTVGDDGGRIQFCWFNDDLNDIYVNLVNDIEIAAAAGGPTIPVFDYYHNQARL